MTKFNGKQWISELGAAELRDIRFANEHYLPTPGTPPIELLARVPSEECGCPEELWRIDGLIVLIHMEEGKTSEIHIYYGDDEQTHVVIAESLEQLRAKMFMIVANMRIE